ncbi:hypothetical protein KDW36_29545, partial [Burkholderia dolosa]|uniref:hypothetical protein n=1 Tax=Burkholderia dolosa TaxID=152500 RepID=UPI001B931F17
RFVPFVARQIPLHHFKLEPLVVFRHEKKPRVGSMSNSWGSVHLAARFPFVGDAAASAARRIAIARSRRIAR